MSKSDQSPLTRTARLLDLVPFLASHQGIELSSLASNFNVTQAQMSADLTTLWMCGLPGYTHLELMDLSFESGFVSIYNAQTLSTPRSLSSEETIALLLGLDLVIRSLPADRSDLLAIASLLVKKISARTSLNVKLSAQPSVAGSIRACIESALKEQKWIEIFYHSLYSDTLSTRLVQPLELRVEDGSEYLWAICRRAQALRVFKVDRIQSAVLSVPPGLVPLAARETQSVNSTYTLHIHARARASMERFSLERDCLGKNCEISSFSSQWVKRSVLASSGSVEVLAPLEVRSEIAQSAASILDRYKNH